MSDFEIPPFFIFENSKQSINFNSVTNVSFWEPGSNFGIFKQPSKNSPCHLWFKRCYKENLLKIVKIEQPVSFEGPRMWQWNFGKWYIFIKALENGFKHLSLYSFRAYRCSCELYDDLDVKTFPVRAMKRCYLQKKMCATIRDCRKAFSGY